MARTKPAMVKLPSKKVTEVKVKEPEKELAKKEEPVLEVVTMEVKTTTDAVRPKLKYKKVGGGSLKILGKVYKKNDVFEAFPEQIPAAFNNVVLCVSDDETQKLSTSFLVKKFPKELLYILSPAKTAGLFNVINSATKKNINEKELRLVDAEKLRNALNT